MNQIQIQLKKFLQIVILINIVCFLMTVPSHIIINPKANWSSCPVSYNDLDSPDVLIHYNNYNLNYYPGDTNSIARNIIPSGWRPQNTNKSNLLLYQPANLETHILDDNSGYNLEVIPNWKNLTWADDSKDACMTKKGPDTCENYYYYDGITPVNPYVYAGYSSDVYSDPNDKRYNLIQLNAEGCASCDAPLTRNNNKVLCAAGDNGSKNMEVSSCFGYDFLTNKPSVVIREDKSGNFGGYTVSSPYYSGLDIKTYPRGVGLCHYSKNAIGTDNELSQLLDNKDKTIPSKLVNELAADYCYATDTSRNCGNDVDGKLITHCTRYKADQNDENSTSKPCVRWFSSMLSDNKQFLDNRAINWCNQNNNKYTPLCDCINKNIKGPTTIPIRNFYDTVNNNRSQSFVPIPDPCWYLPCKDDTYSIPLYENIISSNPCPPVNMCTQINFANNNSIINDANQYLKCNQNINNNTNTNNTTNVPSTSNTTNSNTNGTSAIGTLLSNPFVYIMIVFLAISIPVLIKSAKAIRSFSKLGNISPANTPERQV